MKYNLIHFFYWITSCVVFGYITVFLKYKGLSNTQIGLVSGIGAVTSIIVSPFVSSIIYKIKNLTINKLILILYIIMYTSFFILIFFDMPVIVIMCLYISLICFVVSIVPFLSVICMNYLKIGKYINFGLSRGIGSISYALSAIMLGKLTELFNPSIVAYVFVLSSLLLLIVLFYMPKLDFEHENTHKNESISIVGMIKKYKTFFGILIGFAFLYGSSSALSTYLINIINNLGGNTSLYGCAIFCSAASEMPIMALTHTLLKKYKCEILLIIASICYVIKNLMICLSPNITILLVGMMFQSLSFGLFTATITYYVNEKIHTEHEMMGQTMITVMSSGVGSMIGNIFGGLLQNIFGLSSLLLFICIGTIVGAILELIILKKELFHIKYNIKDIHL